MCGMSEASPPSDRTQVKRHPERGAYDRTTIDAILDEALFCHVGYVAEGRPRVIPTIHVRVGDTLYIHGSNASRTLRTVKDGEEVCVVATLLDQLVLARSAFKHSMNYRSVVVYGRAREVGDPEEKWTAQRALVDHVCAGRADQVRMPNEDELRQTTILAITLEEASAKLRTGPPIDDEEDYGLPVWAGVLPIAAVPQAPLDDPRLSPGIEAPSNVTGYLRPGRPG
jgi:nitroimidazol reductase NimA-like FMN-containing flavoprotein (pyridoxamine 5'-phosphate oxidase superfamily)